MRKPMIGSMALAVSLALVLASALPAQESGTETYYPYSYSRLNYTSGEVFVQRTAGLGYENGEVNLVVVKGDKLKTGNGRAEVDLGRRDFLRLDENTLVEIVGLPEEGSDVINLSVTQGSVYLKIENFESGRAVEVHTPDGSFYVQDQGLFRIDVSGDRTRAYAADGELEAAGEKGSVVLRRGEELSMADGAVLGDTVNRGESLDAFDDWNGTREAMFARKNTRTYLPSSLSDYEEELDQNGRWSYENPYGYVWVPYGISADWRPYSFGRWMWYPVIGWTWISSESWGWSVYHYGRWMWTGSLGWYWIPQYHWRPAWVDWWWDGDYVGWCPLGWYNRPVVLAHGHFFDRYYDRDFPLDNRAMTVVNRGHLQDPRGLRHDLAPSELRGISSVHMRGDQPASELRSPMTGSQAVRAEKLFQSGNRAVMGNGAQSGTGQGRLGKNDLAGPSGRGASAVTGHSNAQPGERSINSSGSRYSQSDAGRSAGLNSRNGDKTAGDQPRSIKSFPSSRGGQISGQNGEPRTQGGNRENGGSARTINTPRSMTQSNGSKGSSDKQGGRDKGQTSTGKNTAKTTRTEGPNQKQKPRNYASIYPSRYGASTEGRTNTSVSGYGGRMSGSYQASSRYSFDMAGRNASGSDRNSRISSVPSRYSGISAEGSERRLDGSSNGSYGRAERSFSGGYRDMGSVSSGRVSGSSHSSGGRSSGRSSSGSSSLGRSSHRPGK